MWVWLFVSLLVLGACIVFALRVFASNYGAMPFTDNYFARKKEMKGSVGAPQEKIVTDLKIKLQAIEDNSLLYLNQLTKLQSRLDVLEKKKVYDEEQPVNDEEEWEELYYKVRDEKEKLDEEFALLKYNYDEREIKIQELAKSETILLEKKNLLETELEAAYTLQNKIGELQQKLEGAVERERELQEQLQTATIISQENKLLQKQFVQLKSETDELRNRLQQMNKRDALLQEKINRLNELESSFEISEQEKDELRNSVRDIIGENETLAAKLKQLKDKLSSEKYA